MTDIERRIRDAYRSSELDSDSLERGWDDLTFDRATPAPSSRRRRAGARAPRVLVAIAVLVVSVSSIAIAQTDTIQDFITSDDRSKAADRMEVFKDAAAVGPRNGQSWFVDPETGLIPVSTDDSVDPDDLRLAISYRTSRIELDIRSAPSSSGKACMVDDLRVRRGGRMQSHSGGVSCSFAMRFNGHVTVGTMRDIRMGTLVKGLADDTVRRVRVRLSDGRVVRARMGRNAFALHIPNHAIQTRGLLVDLDNGTTLDVAMNGCLRSQLDPPPSSRLGCGFGMGRGPDSPPR